MSNYQSPYYQNPPASASNGELGWDSEIKNETSFELLPEGDYPFRIVKFDKARHEGSAKIPPCPKAIVEFVVTAPDGSETNIRENFLLHTKMEWKLSQFFASIGLKKKGEPLRMNWSPELIGKTGMCHVIEHEYTGNDGNKRKKNSIEKLYPSYDSPPTAPASVQPPYQPPSAPAYQPSYQPPQKGWKG